VRPYSQEGITILEALSATGLRSIRFAKEVPGVKKIVANDLSKDAYETIKRNVANNQAEDIVHSCNTDARLLTFRGFYPLVHV